MTVLSEAEAGHRAAIRKFSRGERRNAARALAKMRKRPFREVWEMAYRITPEVTPPASLLANAAAAVARFVVKHIVTPGGLLVHPTKGWRRREDGLPRGKQRVAA